MAVNNHALPSADVVVEILRLIHLWCEIGADTYTWRAHQLAEMSRLLNADMAMSYVMRLSLDPNETHPKVLVYTDSGANDAWKKYTAHGDISKDPVMRRIMQQFGTDFTAARREWIADKTWYASDYFKNVASPANWDHSIISQVGIPDPGVVDGLSLCRAVGKPAFTEQEIGVVRFMHQELARLWRRPDPVGVHTLPPRQREVLDGIRRGETRKAIAGKMSVSVHTVHGYEKALFERADVKSRGELLARLAKLVRPNLLP